MLFYFAFYIFFKIVFSAPTCRSGLNNCLKCNPISSLCIKCEKDIYTPDKNGGCEGKKMCVFGNNHCLECLEDEKLCKECDIGYFPDQNGGCSITDNCEISYKGECLKCKENYLLIGRMNYYLFDKNKLCKPFSSDDLQNCKTINLEKGKCSTCQDGYYLTGLDQKCTKIQFCAISSFGVCQKCSYGYYLDKKQQKCLRQNAIFLNCKISYEGIKCDECYDDYYFDTKGKCVNSNYCSEGDNLFRCKKCIDGYYLTEYGGTCTTEKNCYSGRNDIGVCTLCTDNYYIDFKDGKCKSNQEENDLKNCKVADGICKECKVGFYLGQQDQKCSNSVNCLKSEKGICSECINGYYLGLDNKCTNVEHCIYSDNFYNCIECEDKYYYNKGDKKCKYAEGKFSNCKYGYEDKYCERCKDNFYLNKKDNLCYSNQEKNDFYRCAISNNDGKCCIQCIDNYYLGQLDNKCSKIEFCSITENEERCLICDETYCLDAKNGKCEDNDEINNLEKKFYFRCNKTNIESTACEVCLEGFELKDGLCFDDQHCVERNKDGSCKLCKKSEGEYYEQCLSDIFGCIEGYYDEYCLKCDDLSNVGECTECMENYFFNEYNKCVEIHANENEGGN